MGTIHDFRGRVESAERLLERAEISDRNKELIQRFVEFKTAGRLSLPRIAKYIGTLRLIAERYLEGRDFTALTKEDIISLVAQIERSDLSDWSKRDYALIIKVFYRWLGKEDMVSGIKVKSPEGRTLHDDLVTEGNVQAMIDAANSVRDKALVACLYEGGFRGCRAKCIISSW